MPALGREAAPESWMRWVRQNRYSSRGAAAQPNAGKPARHGCSAHHKSLNTEQPLCGGHHKSPNTEQRFCGERACPRWGAKLPRKVGCAGSGRTSTQAEGLLRSPTRASPLATDIPPTTNRQILSNAFVASGLARVGARSGPGKLDALGQAEPVRKQRGCCAAQRGQARSPRMFRPPQIAKY